MLIKITKSCHNGCIHCCNDSKPSDQHMTLDTFKQALKFSNEYDKFNLNGNEIAGGEPTEHPQFFEFIDTYYEFYNLDKPLTVASNGHFILEHSDEIHSYLDKYPSLIFQITYDNRYYPKKLDITKRALRHKRIMIVTEIGKLYPQGRAITNNLKVSDNIMCPPCLNLKLAYEQISKKSLSDILVNMRLLHKFCTPSIQYDGSIAFGEYDCCPSYCTIYDSEETILKHIVSFDCNNCSEAMDIFEEKMKNGTLKIRRV